MSDPQPDQHRRLDRVLSDDYLADLAAMPLAELRTRRDEAEQEETDLSYLRRLLQGRIDILRAELDRREGRSTSGSLLEDLPRILADQRPGTRGLGRQLTIEPSRADSHRRYVEALVADVDLSDVGRPDDAELRRVLAVFEREERDVSDKRRAVQRVVDTCTAELGRRYRDGEADVSALLGS